MSNTNLFGVDVRDRPPPESDGASAYHGSLQPFSKGSLDGKWYGSLNPFSKYSLNPFPHNLNDKWYGSLLGVQDKRKQKTTEDVLKTLDGKPDLVKEYMEELLMEKLSDENFTAALKQKLDGIEPNATADQTASEIMDILRLVPKGERININYFDGSLNIPTNTIKFEANFQLNTAYAAGDIVIDGDNVFIYVEDVPATNTVRPAADSRAEHLDAGSPLDLVNIAQNGLVFTVTRRGGDTIRMEITPTDILGAIQAMTAQQKTDVRNAINAQIKGSYQPAGSYAPNPHNHNDEYYTETEADQRFSRIHSHPYAPASTISATTANVLRAILGMTETQEDSARNKIEAVHDFVGEYTIPATKTETSLPSPARYGDGQPPSVDLTLYRFGKLCFGYISISVTIDNRRGASFDYSIVYNYRTPFRQFFALSESISPSSGNRASGGVSNGAIRVARDIPNDSQFERLSIGATVIGLLP